MMCTLRGYGFHLVNGGVTKSSDNISKPSEEVLIAWLHHIEIVLISKQNSESNGAFERNGGLCTRFIFYFLCAWV